MTLGLCVVIFGAFALPALAAPLEQPEVLKPGSVATTSATLGGTLSPKSPGEAGSTYQFLYRESNTECEGTGGKAAPELAGTAGGGEAEFVAESVSGLTPHTLYTVCLAVKDAANTETKVSAPVTFMTGPPEEPVTEAASEVEGTTATLHGELNPKAEEIVGYKFTYGTNGTCTEASTASVAEAKFAAASKVSAALTGLVGSTQYTFCLVALHEGESEAVSAVPLRFTTSASAPEVVSESATPRLETANLEAQVNPENQATTSCVFEYGATVGENTVPCEQAELTGSSPQAATVALTGLTAATKYHYRVVVKNATGEAKGPEQEFETAVAKKPAVTSLSFSGVTSTAATLSATVNPNYQETEHWFEYATNEAFTGASKTTIETFPANEFGEFGVSAAISSLQPGTTYYYRAVAKNATGTTEPVEQFTTLATPLVEVFAAEEITRTTAVVSGEINPAGAATAYHFAYLEQSAYEAALASNPSNPYALAKSTPSEELAAVSEYKSVGPITLHELNAGTTYHYALVATNSVGMAPIEPGSEAEGTFTTAPRTPAGATTGSAEGVTQLSARINGSFETRGLQTLAQFEFGTTPGQGSLIPATVSGEGTMYATFTNDLLPGTTYYYRAVASNQDGTSYGSEQSFTTGTFPSPFPAFTTPALLPPVPPVGPEVKTTVPAPTPLTRAQKLAKALKECKKKPKHKRASCESQARKKYGAKKKKKKK
ncbi:MAG TPA: fibronectin type III domain-containing protein [Solirubrobacteraceae bacterium]|nr:fibronectin type III domain-containing protein [Solirubrobacteraceae bacterium]